MNDVRMYKFALALPQSILEQMGIDVNTSFKAFFDGENIVVTTVISGEDNDDFCDADDDYAEEDEFDDGYDEAYEDEEDEEDRRFCCDDISCDMYEPGEYGGCQNCCPYCGECIAEF